MANRLIQKYHDSDQAAAVLKSSKSLHQYQRIHQKDPLIAPVDFGLALKDLEALGITCPMPDQTAALARVRRLLGPSYPSEFAEALARLEASLPLNPAQNTYSDFQPTKAFGMNDSSFIKEIMSLALFSYFPPDKIQNNGSFVVIGFAAADNGFSATAFKDAKGPVIIAFRGSDEVKDITSAQQIIKGAKPEQFEDALRFYHQIRKQYPNAEIRATGHSLGGSLAQLLAVYQRDVLALTCNPIGTKHLVENRFSESDNDRIINLIVQNDPFSFALPQAGYSLLLNPQKTDQYGDLLHPHSILNCLPD
ncbi:MAG: DUF2974 domain-containing protein [Alphaproteobacteria bacterium]|nr:DUF2974 domain-containing protein [Alphaproteobacteria bacterium]